MAAGSEPGAKYSRFVGLIYIFNLIIGTGALALPLGFQQAGVILGLIFLAVVGSLAFITASFLIEAQAIANAYLSLMYAENTPLMFEEENKQINANDSSFEINQRVEVGKMSEIFLGKWGKIIFYIILVVYLFGDLSIYATVVPTSLVKVTGEWGGLNSDQVYYIYLLIFAVLVTPFSLFNFQKTKPLQICTLIIRNLAFIMMIVLGIIFVAQGNGAKASSLKWFNIEGLPSLFGVSVYAFMCHHSLPSIITPFDNKNKIHALVSVDFFSIFLAYSALCVSALFAFGDVSNSSCSITHETTFVPCKIQSLYTLNFSSYNIQFIADFLSLFPVFTLSTNYPLICITLRNNLFQLFPWAAPPPGKSISLLSAVISLGSCLIPIGIAFITKNVSFLVSFTGSYAGLGIMLVMPALLVFYSRKFHKRSLRGMVNPYKSPFSSNLWVLLILVMSALFLIMTVFNQIWKAVHG